MYRMKLGVSFVSYDLDTFFLASVLASALASVLGGTFLGAGSGLATVCFVAAILVKWLLFKLRVENVVVGWPGVYSGPAPERELLLVHLESECQLAGSLSELEIRVDSQRS